MSGSPDEIAADMRKRDIERRINEHATTARLSLLTAKRSVVEILKLTGKDTQLITINVIQIAIEAMEILLGIR